MKDAVGTAGPVTRRVRAYFAPVDRQTGTPTLFDAARSGGFAIDVPPSPWVDLGWCSGFARMAGTKIAPLRAGSPGMTATQFRTEVDATVALEFASWGKLQLALAAGSQQMNLLRTTTGAQANGSGGTAEAATMLLPGSTANTLQVGLSAAQTFSVGGLVAVDIDYTGQIGFVGSGASGAYVRSASDVSGDVSFIRRISLNVARITGISVGVLQLSGNLLAGVPSAAMKISRVTGYVDREGDSFFHEWSGLFCIEGEQGDRVLYHYPRLQAMQSSSEAAETLTRPLERLKLAGRFRALPVTDSNDGAAVVCFRSYLAAQ
jgi:hypothetical protein